MQEGIGREFMERTRYRHLGPSDQQRGAPPPPLYLESGKAVRRIPLSPPGEGRPAPLDLYNLIRDRRSQRRFLPDPLGREQLSFLLWATQGVKETPHQAATIRTVPSAGARHALETYLMINRVEGIARGLYQYLPADHSLALIDSRKGLSEELAEACFGQDFVSRNAVSFFWVAVPYRMNWRYGERGYRYLHLDAGHVCQNLYLAAEACGAGVCAVAAYDDDLLNSLLGLDGAGQFVIYLAAVGMIPG